MKQSQKGFLVWILLGVMAVGLVALVMGVWIHAGGRADLFVAAILALLYVGLGVTMAGKRAMRAVVWLQVMAAALVLLSFVIVQWQWLWPWALAILDAFKTTLHLSLTAMVLLATYGWIRFARLGFLCFNHFETPAIPKELET